MPLFLLQQPQQHDLGGSGKISDLLQEKGAAGGRGDHSLSKAGPIYLIIINSVNKTDKLPDIQL